MIQKIDYGFDFIDTPINYSTISNGIVANLDTHTHDWGFLQPQNTGVPYKPWKAIAWSPELGIFCACLNTSSTSQHISTSSDGKTWTNPALVTAGSYLTDIAWSSPLGLFVATSTYQGRVYTSSNGTSWSWNTVLNSAYAYNAVIWADSVNGVSQGGAFLAVGPNRIAISPFGTYGWSGPASPTNSDWSSIAYSPTLGIACAVASSGGDRVMVSNPTSVNFPWTAISGTMDTSVWRSIAWSEELGIFVAVGDGPTEAAYSYNGTTWTASSLTANHLNCVKWCKGLGLFVAVSDFSTSNGVITSADGINWTKHTSAEWGPQGGNTFALEWSEELGIFVSLPYNGSSNILSVPNNRLKSVGNQWRFTVDATEGYLTGVTTKGLAKEDGSTDLTLKCSIYDSTGTSLVAESSTVLAASQIPIYTDSTTEYTSPEFAFDSVPLDTDTYTIVYEVDTHTAGYLEVVGVEDGVATQGQFSITGSHFHTDSKWDINLDLSYTDDISRIDQEIAGGEDTLKFQVLDDASGLDFSNLLTSEFSSASGRLLFTDSSGIDWVISCISTCPVNSVVIDSARVIHLDLTSGGFATYPFYFVDEALTPSQEVVVVESGGDYTLKMAMKDGTDALISQNQLTYDYVDNAIGQMTVQDSQGDTWKIQALTSTAINVNASVSTVENTTTLTPSGNLEIYNLGANFDLLGFVAGADALIHKVIFGLERGSNNNDTKVVVKLWKPDGDAVIPISTSEALGPIPSGVYTAVFNFDTPVEVYSGQEVLFSLHITEGTDTIFALSSTDASNIDKYGVVDGSTGTYDIPPTSITLTPMCRWDSYLADDETRVMELALTSSAGATEHCSISKNGVLYSMADFLSEFAALNTTVVPLDHELLIRSTGTPIVTVTRNGIASNVPTLFAEFTGYDLGENSLYVSNNPEGLVGRETLPPTVEEDTIVEGDLEVRGPITFNATVAVTNNSVLEFTGVSGWSEVSFGAGGAIVIAPESSLTMNGRTATVESSTLLKIKGT